MKSAVIIGGSAGLGYTLAEKLAQRGFSPIVVVARDAQRLAGAVSRLQQQHAGTEFVSCCADATSSSGCQSLGACLQQQCPSPTWLINAVGQSDRGLMLSLSPERLEELVRTNIVAPLLATQTIVPLMNPGSVIVNIGSLSSYFAPRYLGGYSIAKHGLRALSQQLRMELADKQIHVLLACPGPIARHDSGSRYDHLAQSQELPPEAMRGGGGAKIKGLDANLLAVQIIDAAQRKKPEIVRPLKARCLLWLMALWPRLGELVLRRMT